MTKGQTRQVIGWREWVAIPSLGIKKIKVKLDTGARTSALHVSNLEIVKKGKTQFAEFTVHPKQRCLTPQYKARQPILGFRRVTSSNGKTSTRPVIKTVMILGGVKREIEITLVNRDLMGFRMLLGRTAIKGEFIVEAGRSYLAARQLTWRN